MDQELTKDEGEAGIPRLAWLLPISIFSKKF
jgi:hypothetical protein